MKKLIITALISLILGLGALEAKVIIPPGGRSGKGLRQDRREIRHDKKRLQHNLKEGNTVKAKHNARELRQDKRALRHDKKVRRNR